MTITLELGAPSTDLLTTGRSVWIRSAATRAKVTTQPASDTALVVQTDAGTYPRADMIPLPEPGDGLGGDEYFLGWAVPHDKRDMTALTTTTGDKPLLSRTVKDDPCGWDARRTDPTLNRLPLSMAIGLLAAEHTARHHADQNVTQAAEQARSEAERRAQDRLNDLVAAAHIWANLHGQCEEFDEFCIDHDLPGREHEWEITVRLTVEVPVPVTVSGGAPSEDNAYEEFRNTYDEDDVLAMLRQGEIGLHRVHAYSYECADANQL